MTLTDFLLARIAEDEAVAREAIPGTYSPNADEDGRWQMIEVGHEGIWPEPLSKMPRHGYPSDESWAVLAEQYDPARVLAECEAKQGAIEAAWSDQERIEGEWGAGQNREQMSAKNDNPAVVAFLALPYADHSDYREEWRP